MNQSRNSEQHKQYPDLDVKINENRLLQLQQFARNRVLEPFEGRKSLETVQKTRTGIEKGFSWVKKVLNKTGDWVSETEVASSSKSKISGVIQDLKSPSTHNVFSDVLTKLEGPAKTIKKVTKSTYINVEERARTLAREYIKKGLENIMIENDESWILKRIRQILKDSDFKELSQIRKLDSIQRNALIESIYPYDSHRFQDLARKFDLTLNVGLGAIVATNIPGTGIAVSLINMAKTLVKLGNRLKIMSAIYGYQITDSQALFKASAMILKSLSDWENNEDHIPLHPDVINDLYSDERTLDPMAFQAMIDAIVRKDAYIAIPGVGSISLGKINLDDFKMDLVVKQLVMDHFSMKYSESEVGENLENDIIGRFQEIYLEFKKHNYFSLVRKQKESKHLRLTDKKWKARLKLLIGFDLTLDDSSVELDRFTFEIYEKTKRLKGGERSRRIKMEVKRILGTLS